MIPLFSIIDYDVRSVWNEISLHLEKHEIEKQNSEILFKRKKQFDYKRGERTHNAIVTFTFKKNEN